MQIFRNVLLVTIYSLTVFTSCSQQINKPFYNEIQAFKASDKQKAPPKNAILFVGSSSFAMWQDVQKYFPDYTVINRGFGGSGLDDAIEYEDDIIVPYHPRQVVIYSGENDIATGKVTSKQVFQKFTKLFNMIRKDLPRTSIVYISIKPSPSRQQYMKVMDSTNVMIRKFLSGHKNTAFVDVYHKMLDSDGNPKKELFREDMLHMKRAGYEIWKEALLPYLEKEK